MLSKLSKQQRALIADFNTKKFPKLKFESAIQLFEAQVKKTPINTAIEFGKRKITYSELNQKANVIADFLISLLKSGRNFVYLYCNQGYLIVG